MLGVAALMLGGGCAENSQDPMVKHPRLITASISLVGVISNDAVNEGRKPWTTQAKADILVFWRVYMCAAVQQWLGVFLLRVSLLCVSTYHGAND